MNQENVESIGMRKKSRTRRLRFVIAAFVIPVCTAIILGILVAPYSAKITPVDTIFCLLTSINCTPYSHYSSITDWPALLTLNVLVFGTWLLYALAAYSAVACQSSRRQFIGACLSGLIPLGVSVVNLLTIALQGIRL